MLNNGRAPFLPHTSASITAAMIDEANSRRLRGEMLPPPVGASPQMSRIIMKACAYCSKDRYASASELKADLEALQDSFCVEYGAAHEDVGMSNFFAVAGDL